MTYELTFTVERGWNVHLHAIVESAYLPHDELTAKWSLVSPGIITHITRIPPSAIINYVTKYVTKSCLGYNDQLTASAALRGSRLYQPFGSWYAIDRSAPPYVSTCPDCGHAAWLYLVPGISTADCISVYPAFTDLIVRQRFRYNQLQFDMPMLCESP